MDPIPPTVARPSARRGSRPLEIRDCRPPSGEPNMLTRTSQPRTFAAMDVLIPTFVISKKSSHAYLTKRVGEVKFKLDATRLSRESVESVAMHRPSIRSTQAHGFYANPNFFICISKQISRRLLTFISRRVLISAAIQTVSTSSSLAAPDQRRGPAGRGCINRNVGPAADHLAPGRIESVKVR